MKVCRKCGAPLRETDRYCSQCGAKVPVRRDERRERRRREKEQKEIHFQTEPGRRRAVDSFEEYESRSKALKVTVRILIGIIIATAAIVFAWAWHAEKWMFRPSSAKRQEIVVIQSEEAEAGKVESELKIQLGQQDGGS